MVKKALDNIKYTNALPYFIEQCGNEKLGIMKLNKLFYYLDFISFRDRKTTVTGEVYVHLPKGPFAKSLQEKIIPLAQAGGLIEQKEEASEKYGKRNRYAGLKAYDLSVFDAYEQDLLRSICLTFENWSTDQMVAQTHSEAPWVFSVQGKELNYRHADDIEFFPELSKAASR